MKKYIYVVIGIIIVLLVIIAVNVIKPTEKKEQKKKEIDYVEFIIKEEHLEDKIVKKARVTEKHVEIEVYNKETNELERVYTIKRKDLTYRYSEGVLTIKQGG